MSASERVSPHGFLDVPIDSRQALRIQAPTYNAAVTNLADKKSGSHCKKIEAFVLSRQFQVAFQCKDETDVKIKKLQDFEGVQSVLTDLATESGGTVSNSKDVVLKKRPWGSVYSACTPTDPGHCFFYCAPSGHKVAIVIKVGPIPYVSVDMEKIDLVSK